jgi:hypothetical protein
MQENGLVFDHRATNNDRFGIDNLRHRVIADVDAPVKAGLPDADRYTYIRSNGLSGDCQCGS